MKQNKHETQNPWKEKKKNEEMWEVNKYYVRKDSIERSLEKNVLKFFFRVFFFTFKLSIFMAFKYTWDIDCDLMLFLGTFLLSISQW